MPERIRLDDLKENLDFFHKMYDAVRLVDPVQKKVLEYRGCGVGKTDRLCYDYWKNGAICDNCISVRAHYDDKSYIKLEHNKDAVMLVTAIPIEKAGEAVVLELLRNATDTMMVGTGDYNNGQAIRDVVNNINSMVVKDHLTSAYNRRFVDERLPVDLVHATLARQPLSVIFADIDNMKRINDTYGHVVGDLALKHAADAMQGRLRTEADWVARYGGDEFLICLNNAHPDETRRVAERIRSDIADIRLPVRDGSISLTVSLGVQTTSDQKHTAQELIHMADEKMYRAKKDGKNRSTGETR